jgi:hypothetical protein
MAQLLSNGRELVDDVLDILKGSWRPRRLADALVSGGT